MSTKQQILRQIESARAAHTQAESEIFIAYAEGKPITDPSVVESIQDLAHADRLLADALNELLHAG